MVFLVIETILVILSTLSFLAAIFFSYRLSQETKGEKYWVFFIIAAFGFGLAHLASKNILPVLSIGDSFILQEIGEIIGAFSLAYATFGLYSSMKKIREKTSQLLEE